MLFPRSKLVEEFRNILDATSSPIITLVGPSGSGKTSFIQLLQESEILPKDSMLMVEDMATIDTSEQNIKFFVFDSMNTPPIEDIRSFIESHLPDSKAIITSNTPQEHTENFMIPYISFREYAEGMGHPIEIGAILSGGGDMTTANTLRDEYIHLGQYGSNIINPEQIDATWNEKISIIDQELFEKERETFMEFIRTLALGIGDLFKEDRIAKMMNISRRKVRKYTELLMKYGFIRAIGPFGDFPATELTRHVKLYFSDLSFLSVALGVGYYHGPSRQGVLENFVFLELDRKLDDTHEIRFYRKKSAAEVSFILIDKESGLMTPIDVTLRPTDIIPQALQGFIDTYNDRVERAMLMNEEKAGQKEYGGKSILILPHAAI